MKRRCSSLLFIPALAFCLGWLDYDDNVAETEPEFGKEFRDLALKIHTENIEFEQEFAEPVIVTLKNSTGRSTLVPDAEGNAGRRYALYLILADAGGGASRFSQNLLENDEGFMKRGSIPAAEEAELCRVPFDSLQVRNVEEYEDGMPYFDPEHHPVRTANLTPELYVLKAVLFSSAGGKKPDFVLASGAWPIKLLPKSLERMTEPEKQQKMQRYLARMAEGAYGGKGVSSQLAAMGEMAVEPLLEMAEKRGSGTTRESRIWAIVTLCNSGSKQAEDYIVKRLHDPIAFGDLAFLAWHSQGFRSDRITALLQALALDIVTGRELPWEKKHGRDSRHHGSGCLEYIFKHFQSIGVTISDEIAAPLLTFSDPKLICFGLAVWTPSGPEAAAQLLKPVFLDYSAHPNLKRVTVRTLAAQLSDQGFPAYNRETDVNESWQEAGMWLVRQKHLSAEQAQIFLRQQVLTVKTPGLQQRVVGALRQVAGPEFPVRSSQMRLPGDWIKTWRWALDTGTYPDETAVRFLCNQMRTEGELDPAVKRALLIELKKRLGPEFPLASTTDIDTDEDWHTCGRWLVGKGYFGKRE